MSRLLSLFLVLAYVVGTWTMADAISAVKVFGATLLPLACVWFPEAMSDYTHPLSHISRESNPSFVWFLGWVLLFLPLIVGALLWLQGLRPDGTLV